MVFYGCDTSLGLSLLGLSLLFLLLAFTTVLVKGGSFLLVHSQ